MQEIVNGRENTLFFTTSIHNIFEHMTGKIKPSTESINNFGMNVRSRETYCRARNITYRHIIYPDKITALSEFFPVGNLTSYSDYYRHIFTSKVIDLAHSIPQDPSYFLRTDTHLSFHGMVETTLSIMSEIRKFDIETARKDLNALKGPAHDYPGDIGSKLDPVQSTTHHHIRRDYCRAFDNQAHANDGLCTVAFNLPMMKRGEDGKRLLIFGDSFAERTLPFLAYFYKEVLFCRTRYFHTEMVDMFKPDDLFTESAERYFSSVRLDEVAPRFNLIYGMRDIQQPVKADFYKSLNAVLNPGTKQHETFVNSLLRTS